MRPGVLALQGDFAEHRRALEACGADAPEVRTAADLEHVDALIIPGGESTTILKLIDRYVLSELAQPAGFGLFIFSSLWMVNVLMKMIDLFVTNLNTFDISDLLEQ